MYLELDKFATNRPTKKDLLYFLYNQIVIFIWVVVKYKLWGCSKMHPIQENNQ